MLGNDGMAYVQGTVDFVTSLADVLIDGGHLRPDQVGLGYLLTAGSGQQDITKITQAWNCLTKGETCGAYTPAALYPTLRGVMYWVSTTISQSSPSMQTRLKITTQLQEHRNL
jgi:chitinase